MKQNPFALIAWLAIFFLTGCGRIASAAEAAVPTLGSVEPAPTLAPDDSERSLTVNGEQRAYLLHIPSGLPADTPVPLVLVFHGLFSDAKLARQITGFNDIADAKGFLVVYPNGTGPNQDSLAFDAGVCCGAAAQQGVDEEAFVRAILADLKQVATIDPKRIYSTGLDNGAFLSQRFACEMSGTFAAIASVNGALGYAPCQPNELVSVLHIHGLDDKYMPYRGGTRVPGTDNQFLPPALDVITAWALRDGCSAQTTEQRAGIATTITFAGCPAGIGVEIITLTGLAHSWPSPYAVPASEMVWDFFAAHPKQ